MVTGIQCPICGGTGEKFGEVRRCVGRGHDVLLSFVWKDEEDYERYYADISQFHTAQQIEEGFPETKARDTEHYKAALYRLNIYSVFLKGLEGKSLLDIGAGSGAFVRAASSPPHCMGAYGIEPCSNLVSWAKERDRNVYRGEWKDAEGDWDLITLHDVLEHLTQPLDCLKYLAGLLTDDGRIVVEMPEWRGQGENWRHIRPKQHICLFNRAAGETLFDMAGLEVMAYWRPLSGKLDKAAWLLSRK